MVPPSVALQLILLSQRHTVARQGKTRPSSICLSDGLKHKPPLSRGLRRGDWHSGGRGLSAPCPGHYSRRRTWGRLDPCCQHINLSASWIHQGHHRVADTTMDNCCASFLCKMLLFFLPLYWSMSRSFNAAFPTRTLSRVSTQNGGSTFRIIGMLFFTQQTLFVFSLFLRKQAAQD